MNRKTAALEQQAIVTSGAMEVSRNKFPENLGKFRFIEIEIRSSRPEKLDVVYISPEREKNVGIFVGVETPRSHSRTLPQAVINCILYLEEQLLVQFPPPQRPTMDLMASGYDVYQGDRPFSER